MSLDYLHSESFRFYKNKNCITVYNAQPHIPVWNTSSFPPTPAASKLIKARIKLAQGCWVIKP